MRCAGWKMQEVASCEDVGLAVDGEFTASAQHLDEDISWCAVLGERLAFGKSKKHHTGGRCGEKRAADDAVVGENRLGGEGGPGGLGALEEWLFGHDPR